MIDNTVEPYKNLPERFVTCSGFIDSLVDALSLILKRLPYQFDRIPEGDVGKFLVIASPDAGKLLGKGGEMIRKLSEETNTVVCFFHFPPIYRFAFPTTWNHLQTSAIAL